MNSSDLESRLRVLVEHAWDREVTWPQMVAWADNFVGEATDPQTERDHALFALSRFIYFCKRLVREMLKSLYRDHFEAPLVQRIRRNYNYTKDAGLLRRVYKEELESTRFIGVGNPSESGAHLLYYFRQINHLSKDLFLDFGTAFAQQSDGGRAAPLVAADQTVSRYVFFDDLVGTADQSSGYLSTKLRRVRAGNKQLDLRFMSLFATSTGLATLNNAGLFAGKAMCLFELDESFKAFHQLQRYFLNAPAWFDLATFESLARHYGEKLLPGHPLGYKDGQLLLGFTHNTPDNTLPMFWNEGRNPRWTPIFLRYDKVY